MKDDGKRGIVFIGRPYNLYDPVVNMGLPERFAGRDVEILPYECLIDPSDWSSNIYHMYWHYGERILSLAGKIRDMDGLYPVYFTNFGCGPDSFVLTRFEEAMKGKPYLIVELDEHGSDTGYLTRIEAFMDVLRSHGSGPEAARSKAGPSILHGNRAIASSGYRPCTRSPRASPRRDSAPGASTPRPCRSRTAWRTRWGGAAFAGVNACRRAPRSACF